MDSPIISVIIPVYNAEKTIVRCIDSVLEQSYQDFEILLIDDGSTEGGMVHIGIAREQDDISFIPSSDFHFLLRGRQPVCQSQLFHLF